ncbi:hypothetical protein [Photobacterium leiognathi]|uniref:hypothetical protein n=1 Tax=Photobacterium leiognathi TaxID=553611 RepID=UPI00273A2D26|nr:hypothetical protein [Photobacterium leiognathi]
MQSKIDKLTNELFISIAKNVNSQVMCTPCGMLKKLIKKLANEDLLTFENREDNALSIACGRQIAGINNQLVIMQNSGFLQSINVISSLVLPANFTARLIITMRGHGYDYTQENLNAPELTITALEAASIPFIWLDPVEVEKSIDWLLEPQNEQPRALLISPDLFQGEY